MKRVSQHFSRTQHTLSSIYNPFLVINIFQVSNNIRLLLLYNRLTCLMRKIIYEIRITYAYRSLS